MAETHSNARYLADIGNAPVPHFLVPSILLDDKPLITSAL